MDGERAAVAGKCCGSFLLRRVVAKYRDGRHGYHPVIPTARISRRDCSPILLESLTQKSMKSRRIIRFPRRLGLLRRMRADDAFHTRKTDFEPSKRRRLSRYPNRCVANSTSLSQVSQL